MSYHNQFKDKDVSVDWNWNKTTAEFWTRVGPVTAGDSAKVQVSYWRRSGFLTTPVYITTYTEPHESILRSVPDSMLVRWWTRDLADSVGFKPDTTKVKVSK
jgi:hypothetical protein